MFYELTLKRIHKYSCTAFVHECFEVLPISMNFFLNMSSACCKLSNVCVHKCVKCVKNLSSNNYFSFSRIHVIQTALQNFYQHLLKKQGMKGCQQIHQLNHY